MSNIASTNAEVIAEFRDNGGVVRAPFDDPPPMILLHTIGAKSGQEHVVPMRGMVDADAAHVFATAHGSARHPDWYHNVVANPEFMIELGTRTIPIRASVLTGADRERVLDRWLERVPMVSAVLGRIERVVPVVRLEFRTPRAASASG